MRCVKFLFRCIKDGVVGFLGGDPPAKSGITGMIILLVYGLILSFIIVQYKNERISTDKTTILILVSTAVYFLILLIGFILFDFIWRRFFKK